MESDDCGIKNVCNAVSVDVCVRIPVCFVASLEACRSIMNKDMVVFLQRSHENAYIFIHENINRRRERVQVAWASIPRYDKREDNKHEGIL